MTGIDSKQKELLSEIERCRELINSGVLNKTQILTQSAFIEILIRLNFVLGYLCNKNKRINWNDEIQTDQNFHDITDLINHCRNAACHIDSDRHIIKNLGSKFTYNVIWGKGKFLQIGNNLTLGNEYEDDIAFYYGNKRVFLNRHIKKLLNELPEAIVNIHTK